jgi:mono/diheme cytochrome c family protein
MRRAAGVLAMAVLLIAATPTPTAFGGWAVVTLQDVPEYLEVGTPTTLSFKIRQHGQTLLDDVSPSVTLRNGDGLLSRLFGRDRVTAVQGSEPGVYEATITPSEVGEVSITIDTDLARWKTKLLPFRVVAAGEPPPPLSAHERGSQLFAAKGCATCHAKKDVAEFADWQVVRVGPDLMGRSYPAEWLAQKIADPARYRGTMTHGMVMPALALDEREIAALVSFINGGHVMTETDGEEHPPNT